MPPTRPPVWRWLFDHPDQVLALTGEHVRLSLIALTIAVALAVPIGLLVARRPRFDLPILGGLGIVYTVPSLAMFVLLFPWLGLGMDNAVFALVAYAQVILVRAVVTGLRGVDPAVCEAARGMGMGPWQRLWRVELPLAAPVMLAGARVATVSVLAIATIAAYIDAGGLGELLFTGVATNHHGKIFAGTVAVAALSLTVNAGLGALEEHTRRRATGST